MLREEKEKWTRLIAEWYPRGNKRSRGRQHKRREDDTRQIAGAKWTRIARDRETWKTLEEAFVAGQAVTSNNPIADVIIRESAFRIIKVLRPLQHPAPRPLPRAPAPPPLVGATRKTRPPKS
ncbi:hypothetical protein EVAR_17708_1 [Eumeta japonica]|uniref:Uncharacterized protein n=1 Tax=Eumeta variegata TaxID=151549 RepID=A0A4C1USH1_EUMVA|nr:hypothetical protein EVAR_17708_1 [Eumeta japonica]